MKENSIFTVIVILLFFLSFIVSLGGFILIPIIIFKNNNHSYNTFNGTVYEHYQINKNDYCVSVHYINEHNDKNICILKKINNEKIMTAKLNENEYPVKMNLLIDVYEDSNCYLHVDDSDDIRIMIKFYACVYFILICTGFILYYDSWTQLKIQKDIDFLKKAKKELEKLQKERSNDIHIKEKYDKVSVV
jgi:hypothetical protein